MSKNQKGSGEQLKLQHAPRVFRGFIFAVLFAAFIALAVWLALRGN